MHAARQRGAISAMAAVTLLLALVCLALAVDTGRLYLEQRKLQRVADMAAMESATQSGMCGLQDGDEVQAAAWASARRNGLPEDAQLDARLGDVVLGRLEDDGAGEQRRWFRGSATQWNDAVQVQARRSVPSSLVLRVARVFGGAVPETTTLGASAVARRTAMAGLSAGSGLASVDSGNSALLNLVLGGLLGTSLNLDVVTYQGIAGANVSLLALGQGLQAAGVNLDLGSVDSLLGANVSALQLLTAMVDAADASQVAGINTGLLRTALAKVQVPNAQLTLGRIIEVIAPDAARNSALGADVNLGDLLMATAMVANQGHALELPNLSIGIAGAKATVTLEVIEPPQIAIGYPGKDEQGQWRTVAHTAQVRLRATVDADLLNLGLVQAHIGLGVRVAQASAALDSIHCSGVGHYGSVTVRATPGIASVDQLEIEAHALSELLNVEASVADNAGVQIAGAPAQLTYDIVDADDLPSAAQRGSTPLGQSLASGLGELGKSLRLQVTLGKAASCNGLLSCLLGSVWDSLNKVLAGLTDTLEGLIQVLTGALSSLLGALGQALLDPLLELLGIQVGTLDVRLIDLQAAGAQLLI